MDKREITFILSDSETAEVLAMSKSMDYWHTDFSLITKNWLANLRTAIARYPKRSFALTIDCGLIPFEQRDLLVKDNPF